MTHCGLNAERMLKLMNIGNIFQDEQGQDLIEYTLLLAFVALAAAATFIGMGTSIDSIWTAVNTQLATAGS